MTMQLDQRTKLPIRCHAMVRIAIEVHPFLGPDPDRIACLADDVLACWQRRSGADDARRLFEPGGFWDQYVEQIHDQAERERDAAAGAGRRPDPEQYLTRAWAAHVRRLRGTVAANPDPPRRLC